MASIPKHYQGSNSMVEYQRFTADYFSGCSVNLFFGDRFVDEIVALEFQMQEQILPIYGYASYTYDAICHGQRLVTGTFKINFVESGYLLNVLNNLAKDKQDKNQTLSAAGDIKGLTSQQFISLYKKEGFNTLSAFSSDYEKAIWGDKDDKLDRSYLKDGTKPYFNAKNEANDIAFDILVSYSPGLAIPTVTDQNTNAAFTIESLNDVHIYSHNKIIDPSGQPIQEVYQFMAKDWNNTISRL